MEPPTECILIVEDEALIAMELRERLEVFGYEVCGVVASGEEAVNEAVAQRPDLVLMDIRLACRLGGNEAAKQIRARVDVPVVFLTAYADDDLLARAMTVDPFGYVVKPFEERELRATVQVALYKSRLERTLREAAATLEVRVRERTEELRTANDALRRSEARYRALFDESVDGVALVDRDTGMLLDCSRALCALLGIRREEWLGRPRAELPLAREVGAGSADSVRLVESSDAVFEASFVAGTGETRNVEVRTSEFELEGRLVALELYRDVTERRQRDAALRQALADRDVALREIHHRVKNNLQLVASLLSLQFGDVDDPEIRQRVRDSQSTVRAIALVHERLYQSQALTAVRLDEYLGSLTRSLLVSLLGEFNVELRSHLEAVEVDIDRALKIGLVVNELITNAVKHGAGHGRHPGWVEVELRADGGGFVLAVTDSGPGLPLAPTGRTGFGLGLVQDLAAQCGATVARAQDPHTRIELRFSRTEG